MEYDFTVFIARGQPWHRGHNAVVTEALTKSEHVIVLVGTPFETRTPRNPFTYEERRDMIMLSVAPDLRHRVTVRPILDYVYMGNRWVMNVKTVVNEVVTSKNLGKKPKIALIGHSKDASSYYLFLFPNWKSIEVENYLGIDATTIRASYFSNISEMWLHSQTADGTFPEDQHPRDHLVTQPVRQFLEHFAKTPDYKTVLEEIDFASKYKAKFSGLDYPPVFVTVDACVVHRGHVLLVKRRALPGKGLWALPGGYLMHNRTLLDSMLIELKEETNIAVPPAVLQGSIIKNREFDDVYRSARGRVITHAYLIQLSNDMERPKIRGQVLEANDAGDPDKGTSYAQWFDLTEIKRDMMFEDHAHIIETFVADLDNQFGPKNLRRK